MFVIQNKNVIKVRFGDPKLSIIISLQEKVLWQDTNVQQPKTEPLQDIGVVTWR